MDLKKLAASKECMEDGKWFNVEDDFKIKLRHGKYKAFQASVTNLDRTGYKTKSSKDTPEYAAAVAKIVATYLIVDWNGLEVDGKTLPYSKEQATEFMIDDEYLAIRQYVLSIIADVDAFILPDTITEDEAVKKSRKYSNTEPFTQVTETSNT